MQQERIKLIDGDSRMDIPYTMGYIGFLDVLGFKQLVSSDREEDKEKIERYFGVVNSALEYLATIGPKEKIKTIVISDSVILFIPHEDESRKEKIDRLRHLCIAIGIIQMFLSSRGIWLRGAISSGEAYFNSQDSQVVGSGFVEAYQLEEKSAIYPRVILDNKIISELNCQNASDLIEELNMELEGGLSYNNWCSSILFDWNKQPINYIEKDMPLFIDYMLCIVEKKTAALERIVINIEENIYKGGKIYEKYRWTTNYLITLLENSQPLDTVGDEFLVRLKRL